jgi:hypothetical protein
MDRANRALPSIGIDQGGWDRFEKFDFPLLAFPHRAGDVLEIPASLGICLLEQPAGKITDAINANASM